MLVMLVSIINHHLKCSRRHVRVLTACGHEEAICEDMVGHGLGHRFVRLWAESPTPCESPCESPWESRPRFVDTLKEKAEGPEEDLIEIFSMTIRETRTAALVGCIHIDREVRGDRCLLPVVYPSAACPQRPTAAELGWLGVVVCD